MKRRIFAAAAAGVMALGALPATADEATAGVMEKVILENDRVRVLEVIYPPGAKHARHSHPDHVVYALEDARVRMTGEDGTSVDVEIRKGGTRWQPAVTHTTENIGTTRLRAIIVELKEPAR